MITTPIHTMKGVLFWVVGWIVLWQCLVPHDGRGVVPVSGFIRMLPTTTTSMLPPVVVKSSSFVAYQSQDGRHMIPSSSSSTSSSKQKSSSTELYSSMKSFNDNQKNKRNNYDDDTAMTTTELSNRYDTMNIFYGILWIGIVTLAFTHNPIVPNGDVVERYDAQLLQSILEHPTHPDRLNEIYFFIFNVFAIIPILLSCLLLPIHDMTTISIKSNTTVMNEDTMVVNRKKSFQSLTTTTTATTTTADMPLPPQPFVMASAAIGYFAMGIYLAFRHVPHPISFVPTSSSSSLLQPQRIMKGRTRSMQQNENTKDGTFEWSWYTKNLWENSLLQWFSVAFIIYLPFGCNTVAAIQTSGWDYVWNDFTHLLSSSRFAAISCMDLFLLHITCVSLIPYDYTVRRYCASNTDMKRNDSNNLSLERLSDIESRGKQIAALATFVPYLGTALYIALRPSLVAAMTKETKE